MARMIVIYRTPADERAFNDHYANIHVPLVRAIPGLLGFSLSKGVVQSPDGPSGVHRVATLDFASVDAMRAGLSGPAGLAASADAAGFGEAGMTLLLFDNENVPLGTSA